MKTISIILILFLSSCGIKSQHPQVSKIFKDTLMFEFNREDFRISKFDEDQYVPVHYYDRPQGVSFKTKEIHYNLNTGNILSFREFADNLSNFTTSNRDQSEPGKLFERLSYNVIIFVENSNKTTKFMEMEVAIYEID